MSKTKKTISKDIGGGKMSFGHQMKLQDKWFKEIDNKPEFRLLDEKRQLIKLNDVIEFTNIDTGEKVLRMVKGINLVYFKNQYSEYDGGAEFERTAMEINKNIEIVDRKDLYCWDKIQYEIEKIYSQEQIDKYGLIAIHTEKVGE